MNPGFAGEAASNGGSNSDSNGDCNGDIEDVVEESKTKTPLAYHQPSTVELESSEPLEQGLESEPALAPGDPAAPEEPAVARTAWRQLATHIRGPEEDATRRYDRTAAQIRNLEQDSLIVVRDNALEVVWKPPVVGGR